MSEDRKDPAGKDAMPGLPEALRGKFTVFDELPSTNTYLCERAAGLPDGTAVMARRQTAGRGRRGHDFVSPDGAGLYLSFLLRRPLPGAWLPLLTPYAAVIAAEAIEELCPVKIGIKWVNDLFLGERKICGILTEGAFSPDGGLAYAVIGIGVNLKAGALPPELAGIAGAIGDVTPPPAPERLAVGILTRFFRDTDRLEERSFLREYRRRSILLGRKVSAVKDGKKIRGTATTIDEEGGLCLLTPEGSVTLRAGEVSVRLADR